MTAKYDFRKTPDPKGDSEKQSLHPRIISSGTISTEQILEDISHASTFTVGDLEGMLASLTDRVLTYLTDGYHVELGQMGYFSASLKARPVLDKKEIRSPSIEFDNVNFRASAWFRKRLRGPVQRVTNNGIHSSTGENEDEYKKRLLQYLDRNAFITRTDYTQLTGRLKNKALQDLRSFVEQGIIERRGRGSHLIFVRPATQTEDES